MSPFEDRLRQGLQAFGADTRHADLLERSLATARRLHRTRALAAATASAVVVAGIGVGAWAVAAPGRPGSPPAITTPTPTPTPTPTLNPTPTPTPDRTPSVSPSPPATTPATSASSTVTTSVAIVWCPTDDVRDHPSAPPSPPSSPTAATLSLPSGLVGEVAMYEDALQHNAVLAPAGWKCTALIAEDGSSVLDVSPSIDKANNAPEVGQPSMSVYKSGFSTVQSAEGACPLVISTADLTNGETCSKRPAGESATKIDAHTTAFVDPPTAGNPYPTIGRMAYFAQNPVDMLQVVRCSLPSAQRAVCAAGEAGMSTGG